MEGDFLWQKQGWVRVLAAEKGEEGKLAAFLKEVYNRHWTVAVTAKNRG